MKARVWDRFLTDRDKQVLRKAGYGTRAGFGKRPALLVIDMTYDFTGDRPEPILESIKRWPNSSGEAAWNAIKVIRRLLSEARAKDLPVIYTRSGVRADGWDSGGWGWKNSRAAEWVKPPAGFDRNTIVREIAPARQDILIEKHKSSAFFGTPLIGLLTQLRADSVIVTGTTTSGCVRSSVVDAISYNLRVTVVEDACFDRAEASHAINLCDMEAKYADVISSKLTIAHIRRLPSKMFALPLGPASATQTSRT